MEFKECPRCQSEFQCCRENISRCQCSDVEISRSQREGISRKYSDCLCLSCLLELCSSWPEAAGGTVAEKAHV